MIGNKKRKSETSPAFARIYALLRVQSVASCYVYALGPCRHQTEKIYEYQYVHRQQADADQRELAKDLKNLPGQERRGDAQGEVLGPGFFQIQADSLHQVEAGVDEEDRNDPLQEPFIEDGGLDQEEVDEPRLGVEAQEIGQLFQQIGRAHV